MAMTTRSVHYALLLLAASTSGVVVGACGGGGNSRPGGCDSLLPGDLVITEIMANPAGEDSGNEWFEIYNASDQPVGLAGVELVSSKEDGSDEKRHVIADLVVEPGQYVVVGSMLNDPEILAPHVDYGYANELGDLRNASGRLAVACGDTVIDEAVYIDSSDGASRIYTGDRAPDGAGNDDLGLWCDSITEFATDSLGTPRAVNDACAGVGSTTECSEEGVVRPVVAPGPGDLVITEILANPGVSSDDDGEWFEFYVARTVDLNGLDLGTVAGEPRSTILADGCLSYEAGSYVVVARETDPALNGGLPEPDATFTFGLTNSGGGLVLSRGEEIIDEVTYGNAPDGQALQLDKDFVDATANDDPATFCPATQSYGLGDLGTPGAENGDCAIAPPDGMCFGPDGALRPVDPPAPGELIITEFMSNPAAVDDPAGEWFEIRANGDFDLSGLELGKEPGVVGDVLLTEDCGTMTAGSYAVIAREFTGNGGLPQVDGVFDFALNNSSAMLWIGTDGVVLDEITWGSSTAGASTQLDPAFTDPADNDDEANWCDGVDSYGDGDLGSPGEQNPVCGGVSTGNCNDGGVDRPIVSPVAGDLVITEVMADPSAAGDTSGEWFEVLVTANVDLNGLQLGRTPGSVDHTVPAAGDCIPVTAGTYTVFAKSVDPGVNGNLPVADLEMGGLSLTNSGSTLFVGRSGMVLDQITYAAASAGTAWTLDPLSEDPTNNDMVENFCLASDPIGNGDFGTPGLQGPSCGPIVMPGQCLDGGIPRAIVEPTAGELVITEFMANPDVVPDGDGEWFEVYAGAAVDLNGLELSRQVAAAFAVQDTLSSANCLSVPADSYVLFAANPDAMANSGLPPADFTFGFSITNSNNGLAIGIGGVHLDEILYTSTSAGDSTALSSAAPISTAANDDPMNLCIETTPYGLGDNFGTPGAPNVCI
jgi:hypothetical protein